MARRMPSHSPKVYPGTEADTDDNHTFQQGQDGGFFVDAGSSRLYATSQRAPVWYSMGLSNAQPNLVTLAGFHDDSVSFPETSETLLPVADPFYATSNLFRGHIGSSSSMALPMRLDNSFPTTLESEGIFSIGLDSNGIVPMEVDNPLPINVDDQMTTLTNMPASAIGFENPPNVSIWDGRLLSAANETFLTDTAVPLTELSDNDNGNGNGMGIDDMLSFTSYRQHTAENIALSLAVTKPKESSNIQSFDASTASCGIEALFQNGPNWDWRLQGQTAIIPSPPRSNTQYSGTYNVVPAGRDAVWQDVAMTSLTPIPEEKPHEHRLIKAKPATSSLDRVVNANSNDITKKVARKRGRQNPLNAETKEGAALMRIKHACAPCFVNNMKCSKDDICTGCQKLARSPYFGKLCHRGHLQDYVEVFLPRFLIGHLDRVVVEQFNRAIDYTNNEHVVHMSTGRTHPPITLLACEFIPPNEKFLLVSDLTAETHGHMRAFGTVRSLQYGMRNYSVEQVKQKCRDHIEAISKPRNIIGDRSTLPCKLLVAICRFLEAIPISRQSNLLRNAIMMNRIQYVMGRRILFNVDPTFNAAGLIEHQAEPHPLPSLSSRVLTRLIKGAMNLLLEDLTNEVLPELDWHLRQKKTEYGAICLCAFLVLCMFAEELQVAADGFALFKSSGEDGDPSQTVQEGAKACGRVEKEALEHMWLLLNGILKKIAKTHNSFISGNGMEGEPDQNEVTVTLMKDLRQLIVDHDSEISTQASDQYHGGSSRLAIDHKLFRRRNFGRLISKALKELN